MDFDEDKIDDYTLALLYLVCHDREEGLGARACKGFDEDTMNRLHEKGYLSDPVGKAKSVFISEEGFLKAKELFERHFVRKGSVLPFTKFSAEARKRWEQVPEWAKKEIMDAVWCSNCRSTTSMQLREGKMAQRDLILSGTCKKCAGEVARVIEPA